MGSSTLYKDPAAVMRDQHLNNICKYMDDKFGRGRWVLLYGGDQYNAKKPDLAVIVKYIQELYLASAHVAIK